MRQIISNVLFYRSSSRRNGDSPNSIAHVTKNSATKDVWLQMVATLNTDQNTVHWLHGKRFKLKSMLNKFLFNQRIHAGHLKQPIQWKKTNKKWNKNIHFYYIRFVFYFISFKMWFISFFWCVCLRSKRKNMTDIELFGLFVCRDMYCFGK